MTTPHPFVLRVPWGTSGRWTRWTRLRSLGVFPLGQDDRPSEGSPVQVNLPSCRRSPSTHPQSHRRVKVTLLCTHREFPVGKLDDYPTVIFFYPFMVVHETWLNRNKLGGALGSHPPSQNSRGATNSDSSTDERLCSTSFSEALTLTTHLFSKGTRNIRYPPLKKLSRLVTESFLPITSVATIGY